MGDDMVIVIDPLREILHMAGLEEGCNDVRRVPGEDLYCDKDAAQAIVSATKAYLDGGDGERP